MSSENRLHKKLNNTLGIKDNDKATKKVFRAFSEYYGEKADESQQKANVYLGATIFLFAIILLLSFTL